MRLRSVLRHLVWTGVGLALLSCADAGPTAPSSAGAHPSSALSPSSSLLGTVGGKVGKLSGAVASTVTTVNRNQPLSSDITVSRTIGSAGGILEIPEAGFRLVVPAGAVKRNTTFTVTALSGRVIAYEFSPKGAKFSASLTFDQSIRSTDGFLKGLGGLSCSYFKDSGLIDRLNGTAEVSEVLPGVLEISIQRVRCDIDHFSGYLVSAD